MPRRGLCAIVACLCAVGVLSHNELSNPSFYWDGHNQSFGCETCHVTACYPLTGEVVTIQLPQANPLSQQDPCKLLNEAISNWGPGAVQPSKPASFAASKVFGLCGSTRGSTFDSQVGELACEQVVVMNQTQSGCLINSMSEDPSFARTCTALTQCGVSQDDMLTRADACRSSTNFIKSLIFDSAIPTVHGCSKCEIKACGEFDHDHSFHFQVSNDSPDAQLGNTCKSLQAGIYKLMNSPADPTCDISVRKAANATCWPLRYAASKQSKGDSCSLSSLLYQYYDTLHYEQMMVSQSAFMWPSVCPRYLSSLFDKETASKLQALGFCNSPTNGLLAYTAEFNTNTSHLVSSSTGQSSTNNASYRQTSWPYAAAVLAAVLFIYF